MLLTLADFATYGMPMPQGIWPRLSPHIAAVTTTRLRPLLGAALLDELLRRYATKLPDPVPDPAPPTEWVEPWPALLEECRGLLVTATLTRYLPVAPITITTHSVVEKNVSESNKSDSQQISQATKVWADDAVRFERSIVDYLATPGVRVAFATWLPNGCQTGAPLNNASTVTVAIRRPKRR